MASDPLKSDTDIAEEAVTATSAVEGVLGSRGDIARKAADRLLGNKEEDSLKYLLFVQLSASVAVFSLPKLNDYVKNNSGPLKPAIQTIESTVKTVVTPIYPTFEDVFNKVLKFADNQIDAAVTVLNPYIPTAVKNLYTHLHLFVCVLALAFQIYKKMSASGLGELLAFLEQIIKFLGM
uniref:Rubber elongation factor-like stress related protein 1 n=1 Tax=Hevea brasiliensis TaxID=3981 RepID=A0A1B1LTZ3_HEVBR|nr:rubber elongation factor-like stress related protein 1 [Hevea brasiliensis]